MSEKIIIKTSVVDWKLHCDFFVNDYEIIWKEAKFRFVLRCMVKTGSPVNYVKDLYLKEFIVSDSMETIIIDFNEKDIYTYIWEIINIDFFMELKINDSIFIDTKIEKSIKNQIVTRPEISKNSANLLTPYDRFNFYKNLEVIAPEQRLFVIWLVFLWVWAIILNTILWIHDQLNPDTIFYSHVNSDWESQSPLLNSIWNSWALWAWIYVMIKQQLKKYMTFFLKDTSNFWVFWKKYNVSDLIWWESKIDLENVTFNIVAWNIEKWQHKVSRWSWKNRRTVVEEISHPVRAVNLFTKQIDYIPKNTDISDYIKWEFSFDDMYKSLYPIQMLNNTHGIDVEWNIQLIHNDLVDQTLKWPKSIFDNKVFYNK